jgi:hypothetical protein
MKAINTNYICLSGSNITLLKCLNLLIVFIPGTIATYVRSEVFTAVTMKNAVFWDVAPCISCVNRRYIHVYFNGRKNIFMEGLFLTI